MKRGRRISGGTSGQTKTARGGFALYAPSPRAVDLRFWASVFFIGLALGLVETFTVSSQPLWFTLLAPLTSSNVSLFSTISIVPTLVGLIIDPVIVFLAMFLFGQRFDVSLNYASALVYMLAGTSGYLVLMSAYLFAAGSFSNFAPALPTYLILDGIGACFD